MPRKRDKPSLMTPDDALELVRGIDETGRRLEAARRGMRLDELPDYLPHTERFIEKFGELLSSAAIARCRETSTRPRSRR